jgi:hypothetical protein
MVWRYLNSYGVVSVHQRGAGQRVPGRAIASYNVSWTGCFFEIYGVLSYNMVMLVRQRGAGQRVLGVV